MGYDDRHEILERLEALERMLRRGRERHEPGGGGRERHGDRCHHDHHHHDHHSHDHHHDRHRDQHCDERRGGGFDEKRVIDTIVTLVGEQVMRQLDDRRAREGGGDDHGGEKRIVDLIVGLVSEHVREIVAEELDRRLGRPPLDGSDRPAPEPGSGEAGNS
ncbi:MAG: hypothetical protein SF182_10440 [Deltaproteobacteria bacterium]|nr:hypothetical protein [Deltaproteobacteria bacterium]